MLHVLVEKDMRSYEVFPFFREDKVISNTVHECLFRHLKVYHVEVVL
jgi:hypothetical protein